MRRIDFSGVQQLGRALMLPIAVLPVAALLLRFGQADLLDLPFVANAGAAIFENLGILFAIGIAVGFAKENNGAAGLAGAVGYFVITKGAGTLLTIPPDVVEAAARTVFVSQEIARMSVPIGIIAGLTAGWLYNRFYDIRLPDYLSFFGGRRFVPIATGFVCLLWAVLFGLAWTPLTRGLDGFSALLSSSGEIGLFFYGLLNRLLVITGLHHILNNVVWFVHGTYEYLNPITHVMETARGDLNRFFAGDPTAGAFMSGFFPVMMFGLPAACLAMYRNALPANRKTAGGVLLSMALTSFLTGITEPIEFAFMFLAPVLYVLHALLTGISMAVMSLLDVKLGFGFSAGLIDYVINFNKETNPWLLLPVGAVYFAIYFLLFDFVIRRFDLKTIGRETAIAAGKPGATAPPATVPMTGNETTLAMIRALGGADNLKGVDACTTRLRLVVSDNTIIDEAALKQLGARGIVRPSPETLQVILGPVADSVASDIRAVLQSVDDTPSTDVPGPCLPAEGTLPVKSGQCPLPSAEQGREADAVPVVAETEASAIVAALGGRDNIASCAVEMTTRINIGLRDASRIDEAALVATGIEGIMLLSDGGVHLIAGREAASVAASIRAYLASSQRT